jgi:hypothetical protein
MKIQAFGILILAGVFVSCGSSSNGSSDGGGDGDGGNGKCTGSETRCAGDTYQVCQNGEFVDSQTCLPPKVCVKDVGCGDCDPRFNNRVCVGDDVYTCNADGTIGDLIEHCWTESCSNGNCGSTACSPESRLVYVVDQDYQLFSFDPAGGNVFHLIGSLNCPAGASWPNWGNPATPFSMSVDRNATAWVLYTSGEIFWVSTTDASCQLSPFQKGLSGYELFGMGFVSDAAGSEQEKLYISGGSSADLNSGNVAYIDPVSLQITTVGPIPQAEYSPELTGTGNAVLYAYFPGLTNSFVAQLKKTTGQISGQWDLPPLSGQVRAWAFAHWGGKFYVFITTQNGSALTSNVLRLDPNSGVTDTILTNTGRVIVGAGVSTCAPVWEP